MLHLQNSSNPKSGGSYNPSFLAALPIPGSISYERSFIGIIKAANLAICDPRKSLREDWLPGDGHQCRHVPSDSVFNVTWRGMTPHAGAEQREGIRAEPARQIAETSFCFSPAAIPIIPVRSTIRTASTPKTRYPSRNVAKFRADKFIFLARRSTTLLCATARAASIDGEA